MKQTAVRFAKYCLGDDSVCKQLNDYLAEHPGYEVALTNYEKEPHSCSENLFVVFNLPADPAHIDRISAIEALCVLISDVIQNTAFDIDLKIKLLSQLNNIQEALNHG